MKLKRHSRILYLHSVGSTPGSTSQQDLENQLTGIIDAGFRPVPLRRLVSNVAAGRTRGEFALTFDDGYVDNVTEGLPVLIRLGVPATMFVATGYICQPRLSSTEGNRLLPGREMVSSSDIVSWVAAGMEVGSHSHWHRLATREARADPTLYMRELVQSRELLEDVSGGSVTAFAYPNGQRGAFSTATRRILADAGFTSAFTTIWGSARHFRDYLKLPRCEIRYDQPPADAIARTLGRQDYRRPVHLVRVGSKKWGGSLADQ